MFIEVENTSNRLLSINIHTISKCEQDFTVKSHDDRQETGAILKLTSGEIVNLKQKYAEVMAMILALVKEGYEQNQTSTSCGASRR